MQARVILTLIGFPPVKLCSFELPRPASGILGHTKKEPLQCEVDYILSYYFGKCKCYFQIFSKNFILHPGYRYYNVYYQKTQAVLSAYLKSNNGYKIVTKQ